jgi:nucleotide-binding universal stress UspA family protein
MTAEKRFVVGLDGSDESRSALRWAVEEAAVWDAELDVVLAWDLPFVVVPPPIILAQPNSTLVSDTTLIATRESAETSSLAMPAGEKAYIGRSGGWPSWGGPMR